ncbi:MAG: dihydropteroate synthase [Thermoplasmata archaeon]
MSLPDAGPGPGSARFQVRILEGRGASGDAPVQPPGRSGPIYQLRIDGIARGDGADLLEAVARAAGLAGIPGGTAVPGPVVGALSVNATAGELADALAAARAVGQGAPSPLHELLSAALTAISNYAEDHPRVLPGLHRPIPVGGRCRLLGIVNITPDSFSDGGRFLDPERAVAHALRLVHEGAEMVDLGAESTRPGALEVSPEAEWRRLGPVLGPLAAVMPVPISVDTRHHEVARRALEAGADLVNDVGGLRDPEMRRLLARTGAPALLMHMRGEPATMQDRTEYTDVVGEVYDGLARAVAQAAADGIDPDRLMIDPGLGFGKSASQSLELLGHAGEFRALGRPVVVGASRKSFLGRALGGAAVTERVEAGIAAALLAASARVAYVRTHDVAPTARALRLLYAVRDAGTAADPPAAPG